MAETHQIPQRRVHKRRRDIAVGAGLLLGLVGIVLWWAERAPVLHFAHGGTRVYHRHSGNSSVSIYGLAGEFKERAARARTELLARGFREENHGDNRTCIFARGDSASRVQTIVAVKNYAFESATADSITYRPQPGHISVEVQHIRRPVLEYLPVRWQFWYQRHFHPGKNIRLVERDKSGKPYRTWELPPGTSSPPSSPSKPPRVSTPPAR